VARVPRAVEEGARLTENGSDAVRQHRAGATYPETDRRMTRQDPTSGLHR
jgi:hypothetical protein